MSARQGRLEATSAPAQQANGRAHVPHRLPQGWLTVKEVAERLRFTITAPTNPEDACRNFLRRQQLTPLKRGRISLYSLVEIDRLLTKVGA